MLFRSLCLIKTFKGDAKIAMQIAGTVALLIGGFIGVPAVSVISIAAMAVTEKFVQIAIFRIDGDGLL